MGVLSVNNTIVNPTSSYAEISIPLVGLGPKGECLVGSHAVINSANQRPRLYLLFNCRCVAICLFKVETDSVLNGSIRQ